jgi:sugar phosphate isomerase/epimerase
MKEVSRMRVSVREGAFGTTDPKECLQRAAEMGLNGIEFSTRAGPRGELALGGHGLWTQGLSREDRAELKAYAESLGLELSTLSSDWSASFSRTHPDLADWDPALDFWRQDLQLAQDLGANVILMHFTDSTGPWEEVRRICQGLAELAEKYRVKMGYESNLWRRINMGGLEDLIRLVDEVDNPWFGVYLHNQYPRFGKPAHEEIELIGDRLVCLHSSALSEDADYEKMFQALKDVYDGYWVFEVRGEQLEASLAGWRDLIAKYW